MRYPHSTEAAVDAAASLPGGGSLPRGRGAHAELTATAVLLMLPRMARTPVAVLIDGQVPSSLRLDIYAGRDVFVRLRKGPNVHGLAEPYRELGYDEFPAQSGPAAVVGFDRYVQARFPCSASVFGAADAVAYVPRDASGLAYRRVRIPIPSLDRPSWHEFELLSQSRTECRYRIAESGVLARGDDRAVPVE